jgi:hypothetical protein
MAESRDQLPNLYGATHSGWSPCMGYLCPATIGKPEQRQSMRWSAAPPLLLPFHYFHSFRLPPHGGHPLAEEFSA